MTEQTHRTALERHGRRTVACLLALVATALLGAQCRGPSAAPTQPAVTATAAPGLVLSAATDQPTVAPTVAWENPLPPPIQRAATDIVRTEDWLGLAKQFDVEQALTEIEVLCQPEFGGRLAGSEGGHRAGDYVAQEFEELGLLPAGDGGTYRQEFDVPLVALAAPPTLTVTAENGEQFVAEMRRDFVPIAGNYVGSGQGEGQAIWVNHGAHTDYDGIDASGAMAVCRMPVAEDAYRQAAEHHVAGLLIVNEDPAAMAMGRAARDTSWISATIPAAYITPDVARFLLKGSGLSYDDLTIRFTPLQLATRASLDVSMREEDGAKAANILGLLPGRDPTHRQEIVVLGAHYDHLGQDPQGAVFAGANDDASGVASLLEIARTWQEAGYVPERSVLFAAWDAEESGLVGSTYYTANPTYPLTATVAMLQLDMVGAGNPVLEIDSEGAVQDQSLVSAAELGVDAEAANVGRSDHVPFCSNRIPASMFIWSIVEGEGATYHRAIDTPAAIDPGLLQQAGALAELVALHLSSTVPELSHVADLESEALESGQLGAFLPAVASASRAYEQERIGGWADAGVSDVSLSVQSAVAASDVATATLQLSYIRDKDGAQRTLSYPARYVREGGSWRYDGRTTTLWTGAHTDLLAPVDLQGARASGMLATADTLYGDLQQALALPSDDRVALEYYEGADALEGAIGPQAPSSGPLILAGHALLTSPSALTDTLVSLAFAQAGLPAGQLTWLPTGVAGLLGEAGAARVFGGELAPPEAAELAGESADLWPVSDLPAAGTVPAEQLSLWRAEAESLTAYLLCSQGWPALAELARDAGEAPGTAFEAALGYSAAELDSRWRAGTVQRWLDVSAAISQTLTLRTQAVGSGDAAAFEATVNPTNQDLLAEQRQWFADTLSRPLARFSESGVLEELSENEALVQVTREVLEADGEQLAHLTQQVRFIQQDGRWLYDGQPEEAQGDGHVLLAHNPGSYVASDVLDQVAADAERGWTQVKASWPSAPDVVRVRLHPTGDSLHFSAPPSLPGSADIWCAESGVIHIDMSAGLDVGYEVAAALTQQALTSLGVSDRWLLEGARAQAQQAYDPRAFNAGLLSMRRTVADAVRAGKAFDLSLADAAPPDDEEQAELFRDQSWDTLAYLLQRCGASAVQQALALRGQGRSLDEAFAQATGKPLSGLLAQWRQSALDYHIDDAVADFATSFDAQRALAAATRLSEPDMGGRAAGSPGAEAAAQEVAGIFSSLGLTPTGDDGTYLQHFPISATQMLTTPTLSLADAGGHPLMDLDYPAQFKELVRGYAGAGTAEAEVVWVPNGAYGDARLSGRIVIQRLRGDAMEITEQAYKAGAGGLILVTDTSADTWLRSLYLPSLEQSTIPVVEISNDTFVALLKAAKLPITVLSTPYPILQLGLTARISVPLEVQAGGQTSNVLGLLPGTDPQLKDEVIIVGAHYDHVGSLPDGTLYPGANDDASGVGVLVQLARLFANGEWRPRRSILFAAWGAEEMGLLGSQYYVAHPVLPLAQTKAMIQLDMVGQGRGFYLDIHGDRQAAGELVSDLVLGAERTDARASVAGSSEDSDQASFDAAGVPTVMLMWREGENAHLPSDTADLLDPHKLEVTGRVTAAAVRLLAQ